MRYAIAAGLLAVVFVVMLVELIRMNRRDMAAATTPPAAEERDEGGAFDGWSPAADAAQADLDQELTPTTMLHKEPLRLDDNTVVGTSDTAAYKVINDDVTHAFDLHWNDALRESRWRLDMLIAAARDGKSVRAAWAEIPNGAYPLVVTA